MLKVMGIDVWFERPTEEELAGRPQSGTGTPGSEISLPCAPARPKQSADAQRQKAPVQPSIQVRAPVKATHEESTAKPQEAGTVVPEVQAEPFSLLCFRGAGAILVCTPPQTRHRQRLGRDIVEAVSALSGAAVVKANVIEFLYPPQAASGRSAPTPPDRVLRAFMTRQLADLVAPRVLISADAMLRFEGWFKEPCTVIPPLDELFGDAARKQDLWQMLLRGGRD